MEKLDYEHYNLLWQKGLSNLTAVITEFFIAGVDTTATTLAWAMLYMILNPDIQKKVQEELDTVTGGNRLPTMDDRQLTPYTEAVIHESQRMANVIPITFHATSDSAGTLDDGKYYVPSHTRVACNLGAVLTDPKHFPNPERFDPSRYINQQGQFQQHPQVIPFGIGKRRCIGKLNIPLVFCC